MSLKTVAQKLQVREGQKLLLVNPPQDYSELLAKQLPKNVVMVKGTGEADVIQVFTSSKSQLNEQLGKLRKLLPPKGILWVTYPKGTSKIKTDINRDIIRKEAERFGLEAVAIFSVDNDWSALRLKHVSSAMRFQFPAAHLARKLNFTKNPKLLYSQGRLRH